MNANRKSRAWAIPAALIAFAAILIFIVVGIEPDRATLSELSEPKRIEPATAEALVIEQHAVPARATVERESNAEPEFRAPLILNRGDVVDEVGPDKVRIRGSVVLTDGSIARTWNIFLLDPLAEPGIGWTRLLHEKSLGRVLASGWTNERGEFEFYLNKVGLPRNFRIEQISDKPIGQSDQLYDIESAGPIKHVVPGGYLSVEFRDSEGKPVPDQVHLRVDYSSQGASTYKNSRLGKMVVDRERVAHIYYSEPIVINLNAVRARDGSFGKLSDFYVDPSVPNLRQLIELTPLQETAQLQVFVVDQNDHPVSDFAITVGGLDEDYGPNYVSSEDLRSEGFLTGLPLGRIEVCLIARGNGPPALYTVDSSTSRVTSLSRDELGRITLQVDLKTRLAIQLERTSEDKDPLAARYRYLDAESEGWIELNLLHSFPKEGGSKFESMTGPDLYYSDVLRAGFVELEVVDYWARTDALWQGTVQLEDGIISPVIVSL